MKIGMRLFMKIKKEQEGIETEIRIIERGLTLLKERYNANKKFLEGFK